MTATQKPTAQKVSFRLYDLTVRNQQLEAMLADSGGEFTPEIEALFSDLDLRERETADQVIEFLQFLTAESAIIASALLDLHLKKATIEKAAAGLKARVLARLEERGLKESAGTIYKMCRTANGGVQPMEFAPDVLGANGEPEPSKVPAEFVDLVPVVNVAKVRDALALAVAIRDQASGNPDVDAAQAEATIAKSLAPLAQKVARLKPRGFHLRIR